MEGKLSKICSGHCNSRNQRSSSLIISPEDRNFIENIRTRLALQGTNIWKKNNFANIIIRSFICDVDLQNQSFHARLVTLLFFFLIHGFFCLLSMKFESHYQHFIASQLCGFIAIMFWNTGWTNRYVCYCLARSKYELFIILL